MEPPLDRPTVDETWCKNCISLYRASGRAFTEYRRVSKTVDRSLKILKSIRHSKPSWLDNLSSRQRKQFVSSSTKTTATLLELIHELTALQYSFLDRTREINSYLSNTECGCGSPQEVFEAKASTRLRALSKENRIRRSLPAATLKSLLRVAKSKPSSS